MFTERTWTLADKSFLLSSLVVPHAKSLVWIPWAPRIASWLPRNTPFCLAFMRQVLFHQMSGEVRSCGHQFKAAAIHLYLWKASDTKNSSPRYTSISEGKLSFRVLQRTSDFFAKMCKVRTFFYTVLSYKCFLPCKYNVSVPHNIHIPWGLVRNAESRPCPQTCSTRTCILTRAPGVRMDVTVRETQFWQGPLVYTFPCALKLEFHNIFLSFGH